MLKCLFRDYLYSLAVQYIYVSNLWHGIGIQITSGMFYLDFFWCLHFSSFKCDNVFNWILLSVLLRTAVIIFQIESATPPRICLMMSRVFLVLSTCFVTVKVPEKRNPEEYNLTCLAFSRILRIELVTEYVAHLQPFVRYYIRDIPKWLGCNCNYRFL